MQMTTRYFLFLIIFILTFSSCSLFQKDSQTEIQELFTEVEKHFEDHNGRKLKNLVSSEYIDDHKRTKDDIDGFITYYLFKHQKIHLLVHLAETSFTDEKNCTATVYAAMAGRSGELQEVLKSLQTDVYKFSFVLSKNSGDWLLKSASWEQATTDDIGNIWGSLGNG